MRTFAITVKKTGCEDWNIYGHGNMKNRGLSRREALVKHLIVSLVLQWVTMQESLAPWILRFEHSNHFV